MDMIGTMVQGAIVPQELSAPVAGGGMGTGRQLVARLSLLEGMHCHAHGCRPGDLGAREL